jgi:4-amino-4-deoxy-L-arabinose transferase-like glycosyltransferase
MEFKNIKLLQQLKSHQQVLLIIFAYLLLMAPYVLQYILYLPDERHYVDAAIYMIQHGDYFTPHDPNGGYRFLKPIFTYWAVFASYKLFGISQFSSRLPFLIAGASVLWMTYRITLLAFKNKRTAIMSMLMMGAIPIVNRVVATSLTDIFLLFFLQVMSYGVIGILQNPEKRKNFLLLLYIGAGFGIMVKGVVAVAFLAVCLFYLLVNPWKRQRLSSLIHIPSILAFLFLSGFWYVAIYFQHGIGALTHFYDDQIGYRVSISPGIVALNFLYSLFYIFIMVFPFMIAGWWSMFSKGNRKYLLENREYMPILGFSLIWVAAMIGMSCMVTPFYFRYLIPTSHIIAVILAYFVIQQEEKRSVQLIFKGTVIFSFSLFSLVAIVSYLVNFAFRSSYPPILFTTLLLAIGIYSLIKIKNQSILAKGALIAYYTVGMFTLLALLAHPFSFPGLGEQMTQNLRAKEISPDASIQFYGRNRIGSRIRVASKGDYFFKVLSPTHDPVTAEYVIVRDIYSDSLNLSNYDVEILASVWNKYPVKEILSVSDKEELEELKAHNSKKYYLAKKRKTVKTTTQE